MTPKMSVFRALSGPAKRLGCAIGALFVSVGAAGATIVPPHGPTTEGVDISSLNGSVNWSSASTAGLGFVITRLADGTTLDSQFANNWQGIKADGLVRGAYQTFEPNLSALDQANLFLAQTGALGSGDLAPILDVEVIGGQTAATIDAGINVWVATIESATGRTPIILTSRNFWNLIGSPDPDGTNLWIGALSVSAPNLPNAWSDWQLWMYGTGNRLGLSNVGLDKFNGSASDLQSLAGGVPEPATWAIMLQGVCLIGGWLRLARRKDAVALTELGLTVRLKALAPGRRRFRGAGMTAP